MNIGEANAVNTVLRHALNAPSSGQPPATDDEVLDAMVFLADRASKTLMAGLNGDRVCKAWRAQKTAF